MEIPKDTIILAKTHPPMYLIHKYWARKPYNVVKKYIEKYTKPGDLVLDPFCGSGVTVAESYLAARNAIGMDINPFSIFLSEATLTRIDIDQYKKNVEQIFEEIHSQMDYLYGLNCPYCNNLIQINQVIWKNLEINSQNPPKEEIEEIRIHCPHCQLKNHMLGKKEFPDVYDKENNRVKEIESKFDDTVKKFNLVIPKIPLKYNNGEKFKQLRHYLIQKPDARDLFTKRNLLALGFLQKAIEKIIPTFSSNELLKIKNLLLLTFTANIGQSSKMVWVISKRKNNQRKKREVGSWTHHFFWNPTEFFEINPAMGFKMRAKKSIRAQKNLEQRVHQGNVGVVQIFDNWNQFNESDIGPKVCLIAASAESIPIPDESVDYIFADPPYGDSIQYFELSSLWNTFLGIQSHNHEINEIIINPRQNKDAQAYFAKLNTVFQECYRVLKKNRYLTITFHNTDPQIRNGLIKSVEQTGFSLESLLFQMPPRNSLKSYLHYEKSPVGDYFLRFRKIPTSKSVTKISRTDLIAKIQAIIIQILKIRGEPTPILCLYNAIDEELAKLNLFPLKDPAIIEKCISIMQNSKIVSINNKNYIWFLNSENFKLNSPLTHRISSYLHSIEDIHKKPYFELYNSIYERFHGIETPDRRDLTGIIESIKKISNSDESIDS